MHEFPPPRIRSPWPRGKGQARGLFTADDKLQPSRTLLSAAVGEEKGEGDLLKVNGEHRDADIWSGRRERIARRPKGLSRYEN